MHSGEAHQVLLDVRSERLCCAAGRSALTGFVCCVIAIYIDILQMSNRKLSETDCYLQ